MDKILELIENYILRFRLFLVDLFAYEVYQLKRELRNKIIKVGMQMTIDERNRVEFYKYRDEVTENAYKKGLKEGRNQKLKMSLTPEVKIQTEDAESDLMQIIEIR